MFSSIPQRFTAPLGLLPDTQKLAFRSEPGGLSKLAAVRNISPEDGYWNQYLELFDSPSEVFSLITPHDIRRALLEAPENVATLIRVVITRLGTLISDHTFPSPSNASVAALASTFMKNGAGLSGRDATKQVLNCLRILQRFLPVVFEVGGESNAFEQELLWKGEELEKEPQEVVEEASAPQFVIDDEDNETGDGELPTNPVASGPSPSAKTTKTIKVPSLAEKLFASLIDLLFCCGFTIPVKIQKDHHKINYVIWEKGVGSTLDPGPNHQYDSNKTEVLRLLLVLLSRQIYTSSSALISRPSLFSLYMVQSMQRRDVLTLLCSLLNTAMNSPFAQTSLSSMAGKLPYNHLVFKGEDPRSSLVSVCVQVLVVLLDFQSGSARDLVTGSGDTQSSAPTSKTNEFRYFLMKLHRVQDFAFIFDGILGIMEQQIAGLNPLLPGAKKYVTHAPETVILFWKMIELNKKFRAFVLDSPKCMDFIAYLLCYALEIKDKPQQHGLCRALSYIIQSLSAEQAFCDNLKQPVKVQLPSKWTAPGTSGDFLIHAIYAMVATTSGGLNALYPALMIALSNVAPYLQKLNVSSSARLTQLFASFSSPAFLLSDEGHPRLLFFLLEAFNSIISYHLTENSHTIYAILTTHKSFEDLATFTLSKGLREVRRIQAVKDEQKRRTEDHSRNTQVSDDGSKPSRESAESDDTSRLRTEGPVEQIQHVVSPTAEGVPNSATFLSEKSRGKMRQEPEQLGSDRVSVGRNGFVPTQEWVDSWKQGLPLDTVLLLISELLPKVQEIQASQKTNSTSRILDYLGSVDLKDVLPKLGPPSPRRFMWSDASVVWLTSLIWGEIYVKGMSPLGIWNSTSVRLFHVKHATSQQPARQITNTVTSVVGGFLGRTGSSSVP